MFAANFTHRMRNAIRANYRYHAKIMNYLRLMYQNVKAMQELQEEAHAFVEENLFDHGLAETLRTLDEESNPPTSPSPEQTEPQPVPNPELIPLPSSESSSPDTNDFWYCICCHKWNSNTNFDRCIHCEGKCSCRLEKYHRWGSCKSMAGPQIIEGDVWICPVCLVDNSHHSDTCTTCEGKCRSCRNAHMEMNCHSTATYEFTDFRLIRPDVLADRQILPRYEAHQVYDVIRNWRNPVKLDKWQRVREQISLEGHGLQV